MPMGLDQVWEPLEGLSPGDKLVTLMTPSRTDLALLQSRPNHLQGQRGRSEDRALGPANQNIRDLFPDRDPRSAAGETGRAHVRGPARWARGWPSRTPSPCSSGRQSRTGPPDRPCPPLTPRQAQPGARPQPGCRRTGRSAQLPLSSPGCPVSPAPGRHPSRLLPNSSSPRPV